MRSPPLDWEDLFELGIDSSATYSSADGFNPPVSSLLNRLFESLSQEVVPDDKIERVRLIKNKLLELTDWTQSSDSSLSIQKRLGWQEYREKLKNLMESWGGSGTVSYPVEPDPSVLCIPPSISARQIRLWLIRHGVSLDVISMTIDSMEDPILRDNVKVEWEYAPYVERRYPWLNALAASLGMTPEQVDQAFIEAVEY